jgi:REP element-mobilizing transposase RayT
MNKTPFAYFLTFRTYATWLHGDLRSSVDPKHNIYGTPKIKPKPKLHQAMKNDCTEDNLIMNASQRNTVLQSIINTCQYNNWYLYASHVRSNHIHIILQSNKIPNDVRKNIKIYATKDLRKHHPELFQRKKFWSEGGSDKNIWAPEFLFPVMYYVIEEQGEKMALYYAKEYDTFRAPAIAAASEFIH